VHRAGEDLATEGRMASPWSNSNWRGTKKLIQA
jgi:hypothetical protein